MGATKTDHFSEKQNEIANLAKALGHPARVAILEHLLNVNQCVCGQLVDELPLAQPTVSQHLKELKTAGLISGTIEGNSVCYCIDSARWEQFKSLMNELFNQYDPTRNPCC
jgi:DNA-binding transcriptional ArsR family regulator